MDYDGFNTLINGLSTGDKNTALEVRTIFRHLLQSIYLPGDIKIVHCTQEELITDYDSTGLGIGKRAGWAQCNGLNDTEPMGGRVVIGYSDKFPFIGARGGENTHTLKINEMPAHKHEISQQSSSHNGAGKVAVGGDGSEGTNPETDSVGGSDPHNNMQEYIVQLYLMKK